MWMKLLDEQIPLQRRWMGDVFSSFLHDSFTFYFTQLNDKKQESKALYNLTTSASEF